jgi:hypothetical protein
MRLCKCCERPLPAGSVPQRDYCPAEENPDCARERAADRKATERARAHNAFTRVVLEVPERPRRKTSSSRDDCGEIRWDQSRGGSEWNAIHQAWYPLDGNPPVRWRVLPAARGPEVSRQWSDVDRLMDGAEGRVRALHLSTGSPVGTLQDTRWVTTEDCGSPGELWLRGQTEAAEQKAAKERDRLRNRLAPTDDREAP